MRTWKINGLGAVLAITACATGGGGGTGQREGGRDAAAASDGSAAPRSDVGLAIDSPFCSDNCSLGERRCGPNTGVQTCEREVSGCLAWSAEEPCNTPVAACIDHSTLRTFM